MRPTKQSPLSTVETAFLSLCSGQAVTGVPRSDSQERARCAGRDPQRSRPDPAHYCPYPLKIHRYRLDLSLRKIRLRLGGFRRLDPRLAHPVALPCGGAVRFSTVPSLPGRGSPPSAPAALRSPLRAAPIPSPHRPIPPIRGPTGPPQQNNAPHIVTHTFYRQSPRTTMGTILQL